MTRTRIGFLIGLLVAFTAVILSLGLFYYVQHLRPTLGLARLQVENLTAAPGSLPQALPSLVSRAYGDVLPFQVASRVGRQPRAVPACPNFAGWHLCVYVLGHAFAWSFTQQELAVLWADVSYFGYTPSGLDAAARQRFSKPAAQLSTDELAELIALAHAPSLLLRDSERLAKRKRWLLEGSSAGV